MKKYRQLTNVYFVFLVIIFLLNHIFSFDPNFLYVGIVTFIGLFLFLPDVRGIALFFSIVMLAVGTIGLFFVDLSITEWIPFFTKNLSLVILISFVPILSIPMRLGGFNEEIEKVIDKYSEKPGFLYGGITSILFVFGTVINMGSIPVVDTVTRHNGFTKEFLGKAYTRGFIGAIIWSPFFASVFLILFTLNVSIGDFIVYSFSLAIIQLFFANTWFNIFDKHNIPFPAATKEKEYVDMRKIYLLLVIYMSLIALILLADRFVAGQMSILITIIVIGFSFLWSLFIKQPIQYSKELGHYAFNLIPGRVNEIVLFLAAGFFSGVFIETSLGMYIQGVFLFIGEKSIIFIIMTIISFVILFTFLGVHQVVTITLLLASVNPAELGISNIVFALILTSSWSISTLLSPVTFVNIISSQLLRINVIKLIRWNFAYTMTLLVLYTLLIYTYHTFLF